MIEKTYNICPVAKPRMTRQDKWKRRKAVMKYRAYQLEILQAGIKLPYCGFHVIFVLPMPKSWSLKKKKSMLGKPHQQKPDIDNLQKGFLDALLKDDSVIWDMRATKIWGAEGQIFISEYESAYNAMILEGPVDNYLE